MISLHNEAYAITCQESGAGLVHFKILSENGYVQETAFADGTHIVANFSRDHVGEVAGIHRQSTAGIETLGPESWQVVG